MSSSPDDAPQFTSSAASTVGWCEPLAAWRKLGGSLLGSAGQHPEARRSILALREQGRILMEDGHVSLRFHDETHDMGRGLGALRRALASVPAPDVAKARGTPGFVGGWTGVIAYEFVHEIEPTLPRYHGGAGPQVDLRLHTDAIIFDHDLRSVHIICNDLGDDAADPGATSRAAAYRDALDVLDAADGQGPIGAFHVGEWQTSLDEASFAAAVERVKALIADGDLYQANIATRFQADFDGDARELMSALWYANPAPYMAALPWGDAFVASTSPESLFRVQGGRIASRPIAGTRPRGATADDDHRMAQELAGDEKEQAEHTMLVDLVRNDVARVAMPGTVEVPELASIERHARVMHLVSRVEADVAPGTDVVDWLAALFPGGTITGAPKHRACLRISESETVPRGAYTGSAGYISWNGDASWNILIRTAVVDGGRVSVHAGSGIVMDSDPDREWREAGSKASALLEAATRHAGKAAGTGPVGHVAPGSPDVGSVERQAAWRPPEVAGRADDARVLLVDNYDSFVHNLADYCAALGAEVSVVRNDEDWLGAISAADPTHVILSPGPGRPEDSGELMRIVRAVHGRRPVLGVCLGHQALGLADGARVIHAPEVVHGKVDTIRVEEEATLLAPGEHEVARYHSLCLDTAPPGWRANAWARDGTLMAMQHDHHPSFGLQFHPESVITPTGREILLRFLQTR